MGDAFGYMYEVEDGRTAAAELSLSRAADPALGVDLDRHRPSGPV